MNKDEMIEEMAKIANFSAFDFTQGTIQSKTIYTAMAEALYNANYRKVCEDEIVVKKSEYEELKTHIEDLQTKLGAVMLCIKNTHEIDISDILRKQEQKTAKDILLEVAHALTKGNLNEIELAFIGIRYGIKLKENL